MTYLTEWWPGRAAASVAAGAAAAWYASGWFYHAFEGNRPVPAAGAVAAWFGGTWAAAAVLAWVTLGAARAPRRCCVYCGLRAQCRPAGRHWADGEEGVKHGQDGWQCRDPQACTGRQPDDGRRPAARRRTPCAIHEDGHLYGCPVTTWSPPQTRRRR